MAQVEQIGLMPDNTVVLRIHLSGGGLDAWILTFGAVVQDLRLAGHRPPLVLGLNSVEDYLAHSPYFGATVGRCANRIARGEFDIDGLHYKVDRNFIGKHQLHGGTNSTGRRNWQLVELDHDRVLLEDLLPHGHMGYPGELHLQAEIRLAEGGVMDIRYTATTDIPTLCNIAHHGYFNLTGGPDLSGHRLRVNADRFTVPNAELIPTGEVRKVDGTIFDMRGGVDLGSWDKARLLDHNLCTGNEQTGLREVAELSTDVVSMRICSTEPGLQIYDGARIEVPVAGLDGRRYGARAGIALEPQNWPDAVNHPEFPDPVLRPGKVYRQQSQFIFTATPPARAAVPPSA